MKRLHDFSIRIKLVLLAGTAVFCALLLSSTGIVLKDIELIRSATIEQLEVQARMMEFSSDGVLAFADAQAAEELLRSMILQPAVEVACLLNDKNEVFADYVKDEGHPLNLPDILVEGVHVLDDGYIEIVTLVWEDDVTAEVLGTLYIRANTENIARHTAGQIRYIAWVSLGSLLAAVIITAFLQRAISRPILRLTEAARVITREEDYSIRVSRSSRDELGTLYQSFNQMLDALKSTHDQIANQAEQLRAEASVRKQAEADLLVAKEAAEASSRTKSEFLANMSHEIRTPLTGILGFTDVLLAGDDDGDAVKRREYLSTIEASGKHLLILINDILDLSKIESGRLEFESEACHTDRIVSDVVRVLQVKADEKSLDLKVRWETQIPQIIYTDAARVRQALMNIVGNSIKFTSTGSVEIIGRLIDFQGQPQMQIDVADTGIGIAAETMDRIFDPFMQADSSMTRRFGGTGLGLAISRRIACGLGGDLTAISLVGKGSCFTLRFGVGSIAGIPLMAPDDVQKTRDLSNATSSRQKKFPPINVLLVEDGETNRKLVKLLLQRAGAQVATAENGEVGCSLAMEKPYDVILMDMQMPVLDGYSAARRLRQAGLTTPIIALTANAMSSDRDKCLEAGCSDYLTKPIDTEEMFAAIWRALPTSQTAEPSTAQSKSPSGGSFVERDSIHPAANGNPEIASSLPTDDAELAEIVVEYIDALSQKIEEMEAAWDDGQFEELARLAHWLKGSGGTAGFDVFNQPAADLENMARNQEGDIRDALDALRELHQRLVVPEQYASSTSRE